MTMPNLEIKCTVSDCFFHAKGNLCGAEKIEINMNTQSHKKGETEFGSEFLYSPKKATDSTDTCCKTFRQKDEEDHQLKKKKH